MSDKIIYHFENIYKPVKHSSLTKFIKKRGFVKHAGTIKCIFKQCDDVNDHIGSLPPELLNLVRDDKNISLITLTFYEILDDFILNNNWGLRRRKQQFYNIPELENLFSTDCFLQTYEECDGEKIEWSGVFSDVYKLCFPTIKVNYALKLFKKCVFALDSLYGHGPIYEITTNFCACKSEPKLNNTVYMARLRKNEYVVSKWLDKKSDCIIPEDGPFAIYLTSDREKRQSNYINSLRIDFGETRKSDYGKLSYNARKIYRQLFYKDYNAVIYAFFTLKDNFQKRDFQQALELYIEQCIYGKKTKLSDEQKYEIRKMITDKNSLVLHEFLSQNLNTR